MNRKHFFRLLFFVVMSRFVPKFKPTTRFDLPHLKKIRDSFDDEDFNRSVKFIPIPILEPLLNSIIEELNIRK